jgi:hypothetical protein
MQVVLAEIADKMFSPLEIAVASIVAALIILALTVFVSRWFVALFPLGALGLTMAEIGELGEAEFGKGMFEELGGGWVIN